MCNLSQGVKEEGIAIGEAIGETRGKKIGEAIGKKIGEAIGELKGRAAEIVETGQEFGLSETDILKRLQQKLSISEKEAQEFLVIFGKQM